MLIAIYLTLVILEKRQLKKYFMMLEELKKNLEIKKPILIIAGCVAQAEGDLILKKDKYIDAVIGPQSYHSINDVIKKIENKKAVRSYKL